MQASRIKTLQLDHINCFTKDLADNTVNHIHLNYKNIHYLAQNCKFEVNMRSLCLSFSLIHQCACVTVCMFAQLFLIIAKSASVRTHDYIWDGLCVSVCTVYTRFNHSILNSAPKASDFPNTNSYSYSTFQSPAFWLLVKKKRNKKIKTFQTN